MKRATRGFMTGLAIVAGLTALSGGAVASTGTAGNPGRCGKGFTSDPDQEPRGHSWHALAFSSMMDVLLPPLTEQVVCAGESKEKKPPRGSGLAKAERGLVAGAISAAVSASLAAIRSSLDTPPEQAASSADVNLHEGAGGSSPASCPEGDGTF